MKSLTVPTKHYLVFLLITLVVIAANAGVPRSSYEALLKQQSEELGLYNSTDKVRILTDVNFKEEVLNRNHSILVEFYNSYCGHCRKFAPAYKQLAENLYDWRDVLPISAIDCAAEENNGICREYEIMAYPTLRYFGPGYQPATENYGKPIMSQNLSVITNTLAQFMVAENKTSNMSSWPDFQPVQSSTANLFEGLDSLKKYVVFVYEPENSTVGVETILHLLRYPNVVVKRITDLEVASKYQIDGSKYKIATINRQGTIVPYAPLHELSESYKETIQSFLNSQHITEKPEAVQGSSSTAQTLHGTTEDNAKLMDTINEVRRNKHMVYQADLEMAIRNTLHNEIPKASNINGEKLLALQRFLAVLERYNPLSANGRSLISQLAAFVSRHNQELSGADFENEMKRLEKQLSPIYSTTHYVGCVGSKNGLRGFTCSLWQLFHFMSVQAANSDKSQDPLEVLQGMHGFVKYFFGCTDCSEHFQVILLIF